ncbi:hypothetical protein K8I85_04555, partial [bacterium]|nr:hypothetical protein [bacterium]
FGDRKAVVEDLEDAGVVTGLAQEAGQVALGIQIDCQDPPSQLGEGAGEWKTVCVLPTPPLLLATA